MVDQEVQSVSGSGTSFHGLAITLQEEVDLLRRLLALVEGLLPLREAAVFPLREIIYMIGQRLQRHIETSRAVFSSLHELMPFGAAMPVERLEAEHQRQRDLLTALSVMLLQGEQCPLDDVEAQAAQLIEVLRSHFRQEEQLVPLLEDASRR